MGSADVTGAAVTDGGRRRVLWPLYAAGFVTAFGAHGVAANLGRTTGDGAQALLGLGVLLALYDGAEVVLKPVFGSLADRVGARPVLLGGLVAFAVASALYAVAGTADLLWLARLGQGAAASAFSPAASTLVAQLNPTARRGRAFGSYGSFKSIGYTLGPLLGSAVVATSDLATLFVVMAVAATVVAGWATWRVPVVAPRPRPRQTLIDLARRIGEPAFWRPTSALAAATAGLSVGVGFLPVSASAAGMGPLVTGAAVSVLALTGVLVQPRAGRALDAGQLSTRSGVLAGTGLLAVGLAAAALPGVTGVLVAAVVIGTGTGLVTPVAFAALAAGAPPERLGQTMGAAELGRELGDAGGPLLVAAVAAALGLAAGYGALAAVVGVLTLVLAATGLGSAPPRPSDGTRRGRDGSS